MTRDQLLDVGEELMITSGLNGRTYDVGLYQDTSGGDNLSDTASDPSTDITTEPGDGNYARQSSNFTEGDFSGNWGVDNDVNLTFDVSGTSGTVDAAFVAEEVDSTDTGVSGLQLVANPALSQERDLTQIDTLEITSGNLEIKVD